MPKDRKTTYSDRQSQASRAKKEAKQKAAREDSSQGAARTVKEATEKK